MSLSALSDEELIVQLQQELKPRLMNELVARHRPTIVKNCYRHLRNREEAEDVAQEVLIRIVTKLPTFRREGPFAAWRDKIVYNRCSDHLKKDKQHLHQEISERIADTFAEEVDNQLKDAPTVEELNQLMEEISREAKSILLLKCERGWSGRAIEEALHLSEGAVKMRLHRVRAKLQRLRERNRQLSQ